MLLNAALFFLLAGTAAPDTAPAPNGPTAASQANEKKICRRIEVTGSNLPKRDCRTKSEWQTLAKSQERARELARSQNTDSSRGGLGRVGE